MSKSVTVTTQDYAKIASLHMVKELSKFFKFYESQLGPNTQGALFKQFLKTLTETTVLEALNVIPKSDRAKGDALNTTRKSFAKVKILFQDAIADGYSDAAFKFSGRIVDYYCDIKPMPESKHETSN